MGRNVVYVYTCTEHATALGFRCDICEVQYQYKSKYDHHIASVGHRRRALLLSFEVSGIEQSLNEQTVDNEAFNDCHEQQIADEPVVYEDHDVYAEEGQQVHVSIL